MKKTPNYRRISDAFLLLRLGLSDDLYWDWEVGCREIPAEEIIEPGLYKKAMASLTQRGCKQKVLYSRLNYFFQADDFKLPTRRKCNR